MNSISEALGVFYSCDQSRDVIEKFKVCLNVFKLTVNVIMFLLCLEYKHTVAIEILR